MTAASLKKLTIEHLRGATNPFELTFEKGKKLLVIYGENGTGKSTISDALELIGKGKVGSLENRGLGRTAKYWPSIDKSASDVAVALETSAGTCRATINKSEVVVLPPENRPRVELLRRKQILTLLVAQPGERYNEIRRFIDVSGIEASEAALRKLISDIDDDRRIAVAKIIENRGTIQDFWEEAGRPDADSFVWAKAESERDPTTINQEMAAIQALCFSFEAIQSDDKQFKEGASQHSANQAEFKKARLALQTQLATLAADAKDTMELLRSAKGYLTKHPEPEVCPLCESSEKADGLANRVNEKLAAFGAIQSAQQNFKQAEQATQRSQLKIDIVLESAKEHVETFNQCIAGQLPADIELPDSALPDDISQRGAWLEANEPKLQAWKKSAGERNDKKQFLGALKRALQTYNENILAQQEIEQLLPRLERALEIVEEERKHFIDETLAEIADGVGRLYEAVHPGEGLNRISLALDPSRRASLKIGSEFQGQADLPPQAYFSDSHLDTLGLCVFLALAQRDNPGETILVLDDVLGSVDEPHVERLIEMLYEEAQKFSRCVITTHYRPWKQKLRWGWLQNGQCQFVELTKWSHAEGITLIRSTPDLERLRELLSESPPDPQLVCSKAGVILEAALDFLTQLFECPIPRRHGGAYTLGDLLPAIDNKLRQALIVDVRTGEDENGAPLFKAYPLASYLNELSRIAQARNVFGCHFNELSFDLLDTDALGFGQQVLELMDVLVDPSTGWPKNDKSGSYWATSGETRRLHPLRRPR